MHKRWLFFTCLLMAVAAPAFAQEWSDSITLDYGDTESEETEPTYAERETYLADSLTVQHFDKAEWDKVVNGQTYDEETDEQAQKKAKKKLQQQQPGGGGEGRPGHAKDEDEEEVASDNYKHAAPSQAFQIVLIAIAAAIVLAILFFLFKDIGGFGKRTKDPAKPETVTVAEEELTERSALYKLLQQALAAKNYKLALRYYYLLMIAQYREQGLIKWRKEKTNYHYLRELKSHPRIAEIRKATLLFEVAWYGDVEPDEAHMQQAEQLFSQLLNTGGL